MLRPVIMNADGLFLKQPGEISVFTKIHSTIFAYHSDVHTCRQQGIKKDAVKGEDGKGGGGKWTAEPRFRDGRQLTPKIKGQEKKDGEKGNKESIGEHHVGRGHPSGIQETKKKTHKKSAVPTAPCPDDQWPAPT